MTTAQRALLIVAGLLFLLMSIGNAVDSNGANPTLATVQFAIAVALFYWSARRG